MVPEQLPPSRAAEVGPFRGRTLGTVTVAPGGAVNPGYFARCRGIGEPVNVLDPHLSKADGVRVSPGFYPTQPDYRDHRVLTVLAVPLYLANNAQLAEF